MTTGDPPRYSHSSIENFGHNGKGCFYRGFIVLAIPTKYGWQSKRLGMGVGSCATSVKYYDTAELALESGFRSVDEWFLCYQVTGVTSD
jgi:hypothetical protein